MIDIRILDELNFGQRIKHEEADILSKVQKYFGTTATALVPQYALRKAYERESIHPETKYGNAHMVAISDDFKLIEDLDRSLITNPSETVGFKGLRISKESDIFGKLNSIQKKLEPIDTIDSYVLGKFSPVDKVFGLSIMTKDVFNMYSNRRYVK